MLCHCAVDNRGVAPARAGCEGLSAPRTGVFTLASLLTVEDKGAIRRARRDGKSIRRIAHAMGRLPARWALGKVTFRAT